MASEGQLILIVDDDDHVRDSMRVLLQSDGYAVRDFSSAKSLLDGGVVHGGCLIVDIRMSQMDGLELQEEILRRGIDMPIIVVTGHGDVSLAVRAMKAGAIDFLEKPFDDEALLHSVRRALEISSRTRDRNAEATSAHQLLGLLTPRERVVLEQLVAGRSNKVAAYELGISPRTIEIHRAHIMDKTNSRSLSDLIRIALAGAGPTRGNA